MTTGDIEHTVPSLSVCVSVQRDSVLYVLIQALEYSRPPVRSVSGGVGPYCRKAELLEVFRSLCHLYILVGQNLAIHKL